VNKPFKLAVKAVILDEQQRCLMLRRSPMNKRFVGAWEWPGGKVDDGEAFADAVLRETHEETSLTVEITGLGGGHAIRDAHHQCHSNLNGSSYRGRQNPIEQGAR
jgi:ADP-ribose pyrophosphatase YjhB (NUDIX family)